MHVLDIFYGTATLKKVILEQSEVNENLEDNEEKFGS